MNSQKKVSGVYCYPGSRAMPHCAQLPQGVRPHLSDEEFEAINENDVERLKFGYRLLKQVLFGENSIPLVKDAYEKRMAERAEILKARREAEAAYARAKEQEPFEKYIED